MEDNRSIDSIKEQLEYLEDYSNKSFESLSSIDLLLTSDNNGSTKDREISDKFNELTNKLQDTIKTTNELKSILNTKTTK
ncbi:hypothetical protein [Dethiothermospora halolimnae]|uniref:hypothetical protein n=1 Tax=Dethiothermospora halolimnae TaxID=3114390 RepID=UPI003CCBDF2F